MRKINFRKKLAILAIAGLYSFGSIGCGNSVGERGDLWFDEKIDQVRVAYYNDPDRMEIYSPNGSLVKVIEDDGNNEVGDDSDDKYTLFSEDGRSRTFARNYFIDERGIKFKKGDDAIADDLIGYSRGLLKIATGEYKGLKSKISDILKQRSSN